MDVIKTIFKALETMSSGDKKVHMYEGKSGTYLKEGSAKSGRLGKTLSFKKRKK